MTKQDDNDTPPPRRNPGSEYHIPVDIVGIIQDFRKEVGRDLTAINTSLQDGKIAFLRQDQRIETVSSDVRRVVDHVKAVDGRVVELETRERDESAVRRALAKSGWSKFMDNAWGQAGTLAVLAVGAVIVWLLSHYFAGTKP